MRKLTFFFSFLFLSVSILWTSSAFCEDQVSGLYKAVLRHEGSNFFQYARITLRTLNSGGQLKVSANVKVLFGEWDSNEYMTYEYPEVPLNILTSQLSIKNDTSDVSMVGFLRNGVLEGEWFSTQMGRVGSFRAQKTGTLDVPQDGILVKTLSGYYRGGLKNTNAQSNLPERLSVSFVTTQNNDNDDMQLQVSGTVRFYLGSYDSLEYVEVPFNNVQFNYFNRYLTAKTESHGLTFKGTLTHDGKFDGIVLSDGLGEVASVTLIRN